MTKRHSEPQIEFRFCCSRCSRCCCCLFVCLFGCLVAWLVGWLVGGCCCCGWLVGWFVVVVVPSALYRPRGHVMDLAFFQMFFLIFRTVILLLLFLGGCLGSGQMGWALPGLKRRAPDPTGHIWALPDLKRRARELSEHCRTGKMPEDMLERMLEDMPDRMSEDVPDRM